jgi:type III pantothenate kinase
MNILLVDAGNTRVKWALADTAALPGVWLAQGAVLHADLGTLRGAWQGLDAACALVSNVAGAALRAELSAELSALLAPFSITWFASRPALAGITNGYRDPAQLGCDRFAAAIGARACDPGKKLVVATCGTATTIDAIDADGVFIGGMIAPGLALMAGSLAKNTAQLPQAQPGAAFPPTFANNTLDAIVSGCINAQAGAIERAVAAHGADLCIVSGGAAPYIVPALSISHTVRENLVLAGLHAAAGALAQQGELPC